jgi:YfiH family protein
MAIHTIFTTIKDGDMRDNILSLAKYNFTINNLIQMNQTHSKNIQIVDKNSPKIIDNCDGIITNCKNIPLMVKIADCIPIIVFEPTSKAIGAIHSGREGTFKYIPKEGVLKLCKSFDIDIKTIQVNFGASIQKCCHEVSQDILDFVKKEFGNQYIYNKNIDLVQIAKQQLLNIGVVESNINISNICTKCDDNYFSYRKDNNCGRFAGVIEIL